MKKPHLFAIIALLGAVPTTQARHAPPFGGSPGGPGGFGPGQGPQGRTAGVLTPDEARKLREAQTKVMQSDEMKQARDRFAEANRAFQEARRKAILEADPSLAGVVDKLAKAGEGMRERMKAGREKQAGLPGNVTPEEREKLKKAFAQAKDDPAVKAAREKLRGGGDRRAAFEEITKAWRGAILKADPSLEETLKKVGPAMKHHGFDRGAFAGQRGPGFRGPGGPQGSPMPPGMAQRRGPGMNPGGPFGMAQGRQRLRQNYGAFQGQGPQPRRGWNQPPPQPPAPPAFNPQGPQGPQPPTFRGPMPGPMSGPNGPQGWSPRGPQGGGFRFRQGWQQQRSGPAPQPPPMDPWGGPRWQ